ncbi:MAG: Spy/CpxP family protein refolding chaperone [Deltaproteobacteria bacterium]|nr:Spy/CpxP family protein refolding chaperone [Deltaproteobacteria bacterium]
MKRKTVIATVVAGIVLAAATLSVAMAHERLQFSGEGFRHLLQGITLTEDQKNQVRDIMKKYRNEEAAQQADAKGLEAALSDAIFAGSLDESVLREAYRKVAEVREDKVVLRARMIHELKNILTVEQTEEIMKRMKERSRRLLDRRAAVESRMEKFFQ